MAGVLDLVEKLDVVGKAVKLEIMAVDYVTKEEDVKDVEEETKD